MDHMRRLVPRPGPAALMLALAVLCLLTGCADDQTRQVSAQITGRDPHTFKTAQDMYATAPTLPFDQKAADLLKQVPSEPGGVAWLAAPATWAALFRLDPYRKTSQVQQVIRRWARACADPLRAAITASDLASASPSAMLTSSLTPQPAAVFDRACADYSSGSITDASTQFANLLSTDPGHLDARNDLALCQIHLKNDLMAQLQLETLKCAAPSYIPALVNLTVVYERLGQQPKARALAQRIAMIHNEMPAVAYNAAWYADLDGDHAGAMGMLRPMVKLDVGPKHKELYGLARMERWNIVGCGLTGLYAHNTPMGLIQGLFALGFVLVAWIGGATCGSVASRRRYASEQAGNFSAVVVAGAAWLVTWGLPDSVGIWVGWALCSLLLGLAAAAVGRETD